jgi:hypothetical protein
MAIRNDLKRSIHLLLVRNNDGSYATQGDRRGLLMRIADDVISLGYGLRHVQGLKEKHVKAVIKHWAEEGLTNGTIKNRLSALRYLACKINKPNLLPSNQELGIGNRQYTPRFNRALVDPDFSKINNSYVYVSLQLQRVFGLRREEAIKIKPHLADKGDQLALLPSWCKGGRGRHVPIRTDEQRYWLEEAKKIAGDKSNSLIPLGKSYIQQRGIYDKQVSTKSGLRNLHGLRHAYAQARYRELTGWEAPINGGPSSKELTPEQKKIDREARIIIAEELGHSREQITVNYLAR